MDYRADEVVICCDDVSDIEEISSFVFFCEYCHVIISL